MSAREVHITVINDSSSELVLESKTDLTHGGWVVAPTNVPNDGKKYNFRADSTKFDEGVVGRIYYSVPVGGGEISLFFEDPFTGENHFDGNSTSDDYDVQTNGGKDSVCNVTYHVINKQA